MYNMKFYKDEQTGGLKKEQYGSKNNMVWYLLWADEMF